MKDTNETVNINATFKSPDEWLREKSPESYEERKRKADLKTQKAKESLPAYTNKIFSF